MVVFSHSFALVGLTEPLIGGNTVGGTGVWIFFILSGYLIAASWGQYPRFNVFIAKRVLRIFPGLAVALLLTVIITGFFFTSLSAVDFFNHTSTITYFNNILLYNTQFSLPGVFTNNPFPGSVNGSLWTLAYEFTMYLMVGVLGSLGLLKKMSVKKIWAGLLILQIIVLLVGIEHFQISLFYLRIDRLITLGLMFMSGVLYNQAKKRIVLNTPGGVAALITYIIFSSLLPSFTAIFAATLLVYAIFSIGNSKKFAFFGRYGDFSYGIYIYSFPIQQMIAVLLAPSSPYVMFAIAQTCSVIAGALSWWLVESRFLRLKRRIPFRNYPLKQVEKAW